MLQIVHEFFDAGLTVSRVEMLGQLSRAHGIPTTLSPIFHSKAVPDACDKVMAAVEREWAAGGACLATGADPSHRHQLDARPAQHHVPRAPGLVAGAVARDEGREARRVRRSAEPRGTDRARSTCSRASRMPASTPSGFVVRDVALERNRDLVGRTLGDIAERAQRDTRPTSSSTCRSRRTSARGSCAPTSATPTPTRSGGVARASVRARRRERRGRARRLVRDLRRHRLPDVALRARDRRAAARGGGEEDHVRSGDDLGAARAWRADARATSPMSRCSTPTRSTGVRRSRPTTSPATASAGSAAPSGWTPCSSAARSPGTRPRATSTGARAGGLATR